MVLIDIIFIFSFGLIFGWITEMNIYKMIFFEIILGLILLLLISLEISTTGSTTVINVIEEDIFRGITIIYLMFGVSGMYLGAYLKNKSKEEETDK